MTEITAEGHRFFIGTDTRKVFVFDSDRIREGIEYIRQHDLRTIEINSFLGYKKKDINFLSEIADFLEGIIVPEDFADISILNSLHKLKTLGFSDNKKDVIDLSNFPELSTLACDYSKRLVSLETCEELKSLTLSGFNTKAKDLSALPKLSSLKELNLFLTNIESLDGIEKYKTLEKLSLFRASKLERIGKLQEINKSLMEIDIEACKRISDYPALGNLDKLKKLMIGNSSEIPTLAFVRNMDSLEFFSFVETNVKDGDLTPCIGLKYVGFGNKRHYNLKSKDFKKTNSSQFS